MTRNTIFQTDATVLWQKAYDGDQHILRIEAAQIATHAKAGSFVHVQCDEQLKLRRPISIMQVDPQAGTVDLLYKAIGKGTWLLAQKQTGNVLSVLGPIGVPFEILNTHPKPLLIGGGVGMPPMIFLADVMRQTSSMQPLVILGSEVPFPFSVEPSTTLIDGITETGTMPLLQDWGVACRLASLQGYEGVFEGYVTDLARKWLDTLTDAARQEVAVYSCGPHPMLAAVHQLALEYDLPCQVSLEEFMACGVGGCAGCVVEVHTETGPAMKRVCVDGPVFESRTVF